MTIRDLNGHNAYGLNKLNFRFYDVDQFKNRPNGAQLKKLHFDVISSMSNSYLVNNDQDEWNNETPWYDLWKNMFLDTFEPSDHDFIGSNCGCFFVITKHELPHYKVIFERLCASVICFILISNDKSCINFYFSLGEAKLFITFYSV